MSFISYQEKAFLHLVARRLYRYRHEAQTRGEQYHDTQGLAPLQCGASAKLVYERQNGLDIPVLYLRGTPTLVLDDLNQIAGEVLDGPVKLRKAEPPDLQYVRQIDALPGDVT